MNDMRFLLIEDEPSAVTLTSRLLGDFASRIDDTSRLSTAMEMVVHYDYDVVILDLTLADSRREDTVEAIPKLRRLANAPIVVMTGWSDPKMKERCLEAGADAFVNKNEITKTILMAVQLAMQNSPEKDRSPTFHAHSALMQRIMRVA